MIKVARAVCQEACNHHRQGLIRRRPLRSYSLRASRSAQTCGSVQYTRVSRAARRVPDFKAESRGRSFACSAAVMERESSTANPLLAVSKCTISMFNHEPIVFGDMFGDMSNARLDWSFATFIPVDCSTRPWSTARYSLIALLLNTSVCAGLSLPSVR